MIERWLNEVEEITAVKKETTDQEIQLALQEEQKAVNQVMDKHHIINHGFEFSIYQQLLPLTKIASKNEQADQPEDQQLEIARLHAIKLSILFGNQNEAIAYLKRFGKGRSHQIVHDACLFSLPASDKWNVEQWQKILAHHHPSTYKDLVVRLWSFADKIEEYQYQNKNLIENDFHNQVVQELSQRFADEFTKLSKTKDNNGNEISTSTAVKKKNIQRKVQIEFVAYLKSQLQIPAVGKLTQEQITELNQRHQFPTREDQIKLQWIETTIIEEYTAKEKKKYGDDLSLLQNQETYVCAKLAKAKGKIKAMVDDKMKNILSPSTPLSFLNDCAKSSLYKRANENPQAAKLFFKNGMQEKDFDHYLSLVPQDDVRHIPNVSIDGKMISSQYQNVYITKLNKDDPRAALLGKLTSCCQWLGGVGEKCAIHGITNPRGGFYVLCKKKSALPTKKDPIIAQCWAWRGEDEALVFDSIESKDDFRKANEANKIMIMDCFTFLAHQLVSEHDVCRVLVGNGGGTPKNIALLSTFAPSIPVDYTGYRDSYTQHILADAQLSPTLLQAHKTNNPLSTLKEHADTASMNKNAIFEWIDLCVVNKKPEWAYFVCPFISSYGLHEENIKKRIELDSQFFELLENPQQMPLSLSLIEEMIQHEINLNFTINKKTTLLHLAVQYGPLQAVKLLVDLGAKTDVKNAEGQTPLVLAFKSNQLEVVNYFLSLAMAGGSPVLHEQSILHLAAEYGFLQVIQSLVETNHVAVDLENNAGFTPLYYAAKQSHLEIIQWLVEHGANINARFKNDETIVDAALQTYDNKKWPIVQWLLDKCAKPGMGLLKEAVSCNKLDFVKLFFSISEQVNANDLEPLTIKAAEKRKWDIVSFLIEKGANANAVSSLFQEPLLHTAVKDKQWDLVVALIKHGCDINIKNDKGKTILQRIVHEYKYQTIVEWDVVKKLIEHGADINIKTKKGYTLLLYAVRCGQWEMTKWLIEHGAEIKTDTRDHRNVLMSAFEYIDYTDWEKNWEMIKYLVQHGADIDQVDQYGETLLHKAAGHNHWDLVEWLLQQGANPQIKDQKGETLLFTYNGCPAHIIQLLAEKHGIDVNEKNNNGMTSLHHSAMYCRSLDSFAALITHGANVNIQDLQGNTPLHVAARYGSLERTEYLAKRMKNVDIQNTEGRTALHCAAEQDQKKNCNLLLSLGADLNAKDHSGNSLLDIVFKHHASSVFNMLVEKHHVDVNMQDQNGHTMLDLILIHHTYWHDSQYLAKDIEQLILQGAKLNNQESQQSLVYRAFWYGKYDLIRCLIVKDWDLCGNEFRIWCSAVQNHRFNMIDILIEKNKIDVNVKDDYGCTALHDCVEYSYHQEMVEYLVHRGANVNEKNNDGNTPLHFAVLKNQWDAVKFLLTQKSDITIKNNAGQTVLDLLSVTTPPADIIETFIKVQQEADNKKLTLNQSSFFFSDVRGDRTLGIVRKTAVSLLP